jgi:hypothetical protein
LRAGNFRLRRYEARDRERQEHQNGSLPHRFLLGTAEGRPDFRSPRNEKPGTSSMVLRSLAPAAPAVKKLVKGCDPR